MRRGPRRALAAGVLVATLAASGCSKGTGVDQQNGFNIGDGTYTRIDPAKRVAAPILSGTTLDGAKLSTSSYAGKVVVVNVWGSWCNPCRHEATQLQQAAVKTKGVAQFVGLDTRDLNQAQSEAFVRAFKITYPSLYDPDGSLLLGFKVVPPKSIPTTIVIDKQGRIAARVLGETTASTIEGTINDIAAGK